MTDVNLMQEIVNAGVEGRSISMVTSPTKEFRWYRPKRGSDMDLVLQQKWWSSDGKHEWRELPIFRED